MNPTPETIELHPDERGPLTIWEHPEPGRSYILGVDTAHGLAKGDFAVGQMIDAETCTQVARWRERVHPDIFGVRMALFGWYYNEAILGVETGASSSGVTCVQEAIRHGYRRVYRKATYNRFTKRTSENIGFATNVQTKPMLIARIQKGLRDQSAYIHDKELLHQLRTRIWDAKGQMDGPGHDDDLMAYGIALMVRDDSWVQGKIKTEPEADDWRPNVRFWKAWEQEHLRPPKPKPRRPGRAPPWKLGLR